MDTPDQSRELADMVDASWRALDMPGGAEILVALLVLSGRYERR
jgi:hypothetical protein